MKFNERLIPAEEFLLDLLKDSKEAEGFIEASYEEFLKDNNLKVFLDSLHFVASAKGGELRLIDSTEANIQKLHELFKEKSSPNWGEILNALGYIFSYLSPQPIPSF